jgi:beta-glucosidase
MRKSVYLFFFLFGNLATLFSQEDGVLWKKAQRLTSQLSTQQKIAQTCQVTLDALLKTDATGQVIKPIQIDPVKCEKLIADQQIGSVLNVSSHTLDRTTWNTILDLIHAPYKNGKTVAPVIYGVDAIHGANYVVGGTLFPQEIGLAATWNPSLANKMGEITAYETRASGVPWNFSPVLDLGRQPLWSRFFETLGEDPLLASQMGNKTAAWLFFAGNVLFSGSIYGLVLYPSAAGKILGPLTPVGGLCYIGGWISLALQ